MINVGTTAAMFGIIWIVQLVQYPLFAGLNSRDFHSWHRFHSNRITYIVAPLMIGDLIASGALAWFYLNIWSLVLLGLTIGVWFATFTISVPIHAALEKATNSSEIERLIRRLVSTNWIRTALYCLKLVILLAGTGSYFEKII